MSWAAAFFWLGTVAMLLGTASFWGIVALVGFGTAKENLDAAAGKVARRKPADDAPSTKPERS